MTEQPTSKELIFGIRAVAEAIESGKEVDRVLMQKDLSNPELSRIAQVCNRLRIPVSKVPVQKIEQFTRKNHQGIVCFMAAVSFASLDGVISNAYAEGRNPFLLVLDRITDVRNFGAIVRTAECAGVDAVVIPAKGVARLGGDAFKTSAGALSHVPICREKDLMHTIKFLKNNGLHVVGCTEKTNQLLYQISYDQPLAILLGSEEDGIEPDLLKMCDSLAKIPLQGKIESLNVSVAAGIIVYEALRQKSYTQAP